MKCGARKGEESPLASAPAPALTLNSKKDFDNGVVVDICGHKFIIYVGNGENSEGRCVFDIDWKNLYRECHLKEHLSAYKTGKASIDVLWQKIRKKKEAE